APFQTVGDVQRRVQSHFEGRGQVKVDVVLDGRVDARREAGGGVRPHRRVGSVGDVVGDFRHAIAQAQVVVGAVVQFALDARNVGHVHYLTAEHRGVAAREPLQEGEAVRI